MGGFSRFWDIVILLLCVPVLYLYLDGMSLAFHTHLPNSVSKSRFNRVCFLILVSIRAVFSLSALFNKRRKGLVA